MSYRQDRKMKNIGLFLILAILLFFSVPVYAEIGIVDRPYVVWATILNGTNFYNADSAEISLLAPDGSYFVENATMTAQGIGTFIYNFTPNKVGNWLSYATFYAGSSPVSTGVQGFSVIESESETITEEFSMIGIVLGLVALIAFLLYVGNQWSKPAPGIPETDPSNENRRYFGVLFYFFAMLIFLILVFIFMESSTGMAYYGVMRALFIVFSVLVGLIVSIGTMAVFFLMFYGWYKNASRS